jgi:hypothetical protein
MVYRSFRAPTGYTVLAAALLLAAPQLLPDRALAQQPAPSRIGNRWDGLSHQPTQRDVGAAERELGVAPPTEHDRALDEELERLDRQLLNQEQSSPPVNSR